MKLSKLSDSYINSWQELQADRARELAGVLKGVF